MDTDELTSERINFDVASLCFMIKNILKQNVNDADNYYRLLQSEGITLPLLITPKWEAWRQKVQED